MITRRHRAEGIDSAALWSECGHYRYRLERRWGAGPVLNWIMLNPSRATERQNDPTIERCQRRAAALGFAAISVTNLFALCATRPADLKAAADPVGAGCDAVLRAAAERADMVLCAWGVHGAHLGRNRAVLALLEGLPLHVLGLTRAGHPRHPLYVPYSARPVPWPGGANAAPEISTGAAIL